jgi:CPA2 family monovalent cation:H+ antiporter-2
MSLVGLSPALGTFLAGVVLANSEYRHELESNIDPFRGLLLGLFFMTVGAGINFALLADELAIIAGATFGLIGLKIGILLILGHFFGLRGSDRWLFALCLAQAGEFGFVLLSFTVASGVIPQVLADQLLLIVALSMILTPALFILYDKVIAPRFVGGSDREADVIDQQGSIIIAGHGRIGGIVNRMARGAGFETTVVDYSSAQLEMLRAFDINVYFGDATRPDLLHAAGIDEAKILVVAIDGKDQITNLVRYAIQNYPHLHVVARAIDRTHVYDLYSMGCRDIIRETYDSSVRMGRSVFEALGINRAEADRMAGEFEILDRSAIVEMASVYDSNIPSHENEAFIAHLNALRDDWEEQLRGKMAPRQNIGETDRD